MDEPDGERAATGRRSVLRAAAGAGALAGCFGDDGPEIETRTGALFDESLELAVTGLDAEATVTLRVGSRFGSGNFESRATFEADGDGVVDVSETAPIEGTYEGAAPMGPIWSMRPQGLLDDARLDVSPDALDAEAKTQTLSLAAYVDDERVASRETIRYVGSPDVIRRRPESDDLAGVAAIPPGGRPYPGVLLLHGGSGALPNRVALQLAAHGIAAFAVRYFGDDPAVPDRQVRVPMAYFDRAIEWFAGLDDVADDRVGAMGWSLGGTLAQLLGARRDDVGAVVAYSSLPYAFQFSTFPDGAWAADGETLPYVEIPFHEGDRRDGKRRTRPAFEAGFERAGENEIEAARIPIEEIDGPVLYVSGEADATLPATTYCDRAIDWLTEVDHPYEYEHLAYEDAGRAISAPYAPTTTRAETADRIHGGTPAGAARADADSWPVVREYLKKGLGQG